MLPEQIITYSLFLVAVISAVMVIVSRNPINSALYLVLNFFTLGGLYLTLNAQFIAMVHILVYAGAIMVLFLFVIMLLNLGDEKQFVEKLNKKNFVGIFLSIAFFAELVYIFAFLSPSGAKALSLNSVEIGTVEYLGKILFTSYVFPFEITSFLLLASIIGAVILAKKKNLE
ncbi:MAG: NADH-quinone oxidoreductase subunit J [Bacteroidota bacterium]